MAAFGILITDYWFVPNLPPCNPGDIRDCFPRWQ